jgi:predicted small lipoprotein YifL
MTGILALEGCGRKGLPEPPSAAAAQKTSPTDRGSANSQVKLPRGIDDPSLKAGATKNSTPFDFLL